MDIGLIITCALVLAAFVVLVIIFFTVRRKMKNFSRSIFGTDSLLQGLSRQQEMVSETPKSLHGMTSVYLPQILQDFPEFDFELYKNKAQSVLRSYLNAISGKKESALAEECSLTLRNYVRGIIDDLCARCVTQTYSEVVIHDTQISRYIKDGKTVTIVFELSVGCLSYITDAEGKIVFGDNKMKTQTVYEVGLMYVQDADKLADMGEALGINCPNCGAPIKNLGLKTCEYCGTSVKEVNVRAWKFSSVKEQTTQRRRF